MRHRDTASTITVALLVCAGHGATVGGIVAINAVVAVNTVSTNTVITTNAIVADSTCATNASVTNVFADNSALCDQHCHNRHPHG